LTSQSVYRGPFGTPRPPGARRFALPPAAMPSHHGRRPLKAWRYVGVFGPQLMICAAAVRIGRARQSFWAVWDREARALRERTALGRGGVLLGYGRVVVRGRGIALDLALDEMPGVETVCAAGADIDAGAYAWTRKQGGVGAHGTLSLDGGPARPIDARAVIDDTAAYYPRHTRWRWSAGVGVAVDGRALAWNLVEGVNDPLSGSERTVWVDGVPAETPPVRFAADLSSVAGVSSAAGVSGAAAGSAGGGVLLFSAEAVRERRENLLLVRSRYRQPFGTFSGELPGTGIALASGFGVMEDHDVWW